MSLNYLKSKRIIKKTSQIFEAERKLLIDKGFNSWPSIMLLTDEEINTLVKNSLITTRNLRRLRCIAMFISEINLSIGDAALLMYSGIPSIDALARLSPQELLDKTGRLERLLNTGRKPVANLKTANIWIDRAKRLKPTKGTINHL
tara:strand:- start:5762 stop:6199 length:438 start_codon:yes stop_codon:yes gene_type:complete